MKHRIHNVSFFVVTILWYSFTWAPIIAQTSNEKTTKSEDLVRATAEGYFQNRNSFKFIDCKFRLLEGNADNRQKVLDLEFAKDKVQYGTWRVNDDKVYYELVCDKNWQKKTSSVIIQAKERVGSEKIQVSVPCLDSIFLYNRRFHLVFHPVGMAVNIRKEWGTRPHIFFSPFTYAGSLSTGGEEEASPAHYLRMALEHKIAFEILESTDPKCIRISLGELKGNKELLLDFDAERGFLLSGLQRFDRKTDKLRTEMKVLKSEQRGNRWFPTHIVKFYYPDVDQQQFAVTELVVDMLDVDSVPDRKGFSLALPAGATINDPDRNILLKLNRARIIAESDLDKVYQDALKYTADYQKMLDESSQPPRTIPNVNPNRRSYAAAAVVGLVLLLIATGMVLLRLKGRNK